MGSTGCVITASVKSSVTAPLLTLTSIRRGTSHGPVRSTLEDWQSIRTRSLGAGAPSTVPAADGRSLVTEASSA